MLVCLQTASCSHASMRQIQTCKKTTFRFCRATHNRLRSQPCFLLMATKSSLFLILFGSLCCSGCCGCFECVSLPYSFSQEMTFSPEKRAYETGDTIWLESRFDCTGMFNSASNQTEDFCDANSLGTNLKVYELAKDSMGNILGAVNSFDYLSTEGSIYTDASVPSPHKVKQISFDNAGGLYSIKIAIIPREKGIFGVFLSEGIGKIKGKCYCDGTAGFAFTVANKEAHFDLYENFFSPEPVPDDDIGVGYFFEVQ